MRNMWVYDLETFVGDDGNLQCYAAGAINLESILKLPSMCKVLKQLKFKHQSLSNVQIHNLVNEYQVNEEH